MALTFQVLCLPLDDRPCNTDAMKDLAGVAGLDLRLPPLELIRTHQEKYDFERCYQWLDFQMGWNRAALISLEMFLYGGLINSRKATVAPEEVERRMELLFDLIRLYPECRVYVSAVLLRLSITVDEKQTEQNWRDVFRYSVLKDQVETDSQFQKELDEVQAHIPPAILSEYLSVRARNFGAMTKLLEISDKASYLIYGQEDCSAFGIHRQEKSELRRSIQRLPSGKNITVCTGADELQSMMLLRAYMDEKQVSPGSIKLDFLGATVEDFAKVSAYEDITIGENIEAHLEPTCFRRDANGPQLKILTTVFDKKQRDVFFEDPEAVEVPAFSSFEVDAFLELSSANGAQDVLTSKVMATKPRLTLKAFSAWNTTGNRVGTLIAHLGLREVAIQNSTFNDVADRRYLNLHLLDDWIYQGCVRKKLLEYCKNSSENPWALSEEAWKKLSILCDEAMQAEVAMRGIKVEKFCASLPWKRVFEVRILWVNGSDF